MIPSATEAALLRAICEQPAEDTPRLVFADYLDERGRPELSAWAAYIRGTITAPRMLDDFTDGRLYERFGGEWAAVVWGRRLGIADTTNLQLAHLWSRGFPSRLRFASVRAWQRACRDGLFLRVPVASCEVKGREPDAAPDPRTPGRQWYQWWAHGGGRLLSPAYLPSDVFTELVQFRMRPHLDIHDRGVALTDAWHAFAVAGRAACRQPTAEVTA